MKRMGAFKETEREEMKKLEESVAAAAPAAEKAECCCGGKAKQEVEPIEVLTDRNAQWRVDLRATMKPKDRTAIERCVMNELAPDYRRHSRKEEVNQGLTEEQALLEAKRCLDCANPSCMEGCPVNIEIPSFIKNIERGNYLAAAKVLKHTSALPAVCGRVCRCHRLSGAFRCRLRA